MSQFKAGDKVMCVDSSSWEGRLTVGSTYVVKEHGNLVELVGTPHLFSPDRFKSLHDDIVLQAAMSHTNGFLKEKHDFTGVLTHYNPLSKPTVIRSEQIRPWDVDDSLILHGDKGHPDFAMVDIIDSVENKTITVKVHEPMVRLLKEEHARGSYIIVWSRSGFAWAEAVVKALGLTDKVHLIMSKPMVYFDDMPVETWMKDRVYLSPDQHYKK